MTILTSYIQLSGNRILVETGPVSDTRHDYKRFVPTYRIYGPLQQVVRKQYVQCTARHDVMINSHSGIHDASHLHDSLLKQLT